MNIMRTALSLGGGTTDASSSTEPTASADESSNGGDGDDEASDSTWRDCEAKTRKDQENGLMKSLKILVELTHWILAFLAAW
jgi:hypothetical protein